jgi:hypothetical protein
MVTATPLHEKPSDVTVIVEKPVMLATFQEAIRQAIA